MTPRLFCDIINQEALILSGETTFFPLLRDFSALETFMDILQQINEIVKEFRGEDVNLKIDDNFNELGFDSLDRVELVMELESRFDISFPDDLQIETVKELVDTIEKLTKK